jgi:MFS family permease
VAGVLDYGIGASMHQFLPAFLATLWPVWAISLAGFLRHVCAAVGYRMGGRLVEKFNGLRVLIWGNAVSFAVGTAIVAYPTTATPLLGSLTSFAYGTSNVAQSALLQKEFSDAERATMGSLISLGGSIFFAGAAFLLGVLADRVGSRWTLLVAQLSFVLVLYLYWRLFHKTTEDQTAV